MHIEAMTDMYLYAALSSVGITVEANRLKGVMLPALAMVVRSPTECWIAWGLQVSFRVSHHDMTLLASSLLHC